MQIQDFMFKVKNCLYFNVAVKSVLYALRKNVGLSNHPGSIMWEGVTQKQNDLLGPIRRQGSTSH